ncbi:hypothetical protein Tco_0383113 [Tanacetum coccineum]
MYLTTSRPDIHFLNCLCARYQANPKESHIIVVKRIFRKSTSAEYVAAARCCANILSMKSQLSDYDIVYEKRSYHKRGHELHIILTQYQLADIFTKLLDEPTFKRLIVELGEVGLTSFGNAIGANYLPHLKDYVDLPTQSIVKQFFTEIGYSDQIEATGTLRKSYAMILYCMENGVKIDFAKVIWDDLLSKLQKKHKEKVIPYSRFISLLLEHKMKETYENPKATSIHTPIFSVNNWTLKKDQPEGPPFTAHTLYICTLDSPEEFKAPKTTPKTEELYPKGKKPGAKNGSKNIHSKSASGHNASTYLTVEADLGKSNPKNFLPQKQDDLTELVKDTCTTTMDLDSPEDDQPLQMSSEDEADIQAETKDTSLTELLVNALKSKLAKLLKNHDLSTSIPTELEELLSKLDYLMKVVDAILTSIGSQLTKLKVLDVILSLLDTVVAALDRFAKSIDSASQKAIDQIVPSAGQAGTHHAEGEKNT